MPSTVTVIGNVVADIVARPVDEVPRTGSLHPEAVRYFPGGCAGNAATVLARLGVAARLVACVGDDPLGDLLLMGWAREGVRAEAVRHVAGMATGVAIVLVDSAGERRFISTPGANDALRPSDLTDALLDGSAALHVGGLFAAPGLEDGTLPERLAAARVRGLLVSLDMVGGSARDRREALYPLLPHVDLLLLNEDEGEKVTGEREPKGIIAALRGRGARTVVLKFGERGGVVDEGGERWGWAPVPARAVDSTGAGDAFAATLVAARVRGDSLRAAVRWASLAGALTVEGLGSTGAWAGWEALERRATLPEAPPTSGRSSP